MSLVETGKVGEEGLGGPRGLPLRSPVPGTQERELKAWYLSASSTSFTALKGTSVR